MIDLDARFERRGLHFHEIADLRTITERGARAQPRKGPTKAFFPIEACTMCEKEWITAPSAMVTPGPITTNGSIVTSLPNLVSAERKTVPARLA